MSQPTRDTQTATAPRPDAPDTVRVPIRVRYAECDAMNVAHHASYVVWMEAARIELLRARGVVYTDLEARGVFFVVTDLSVKYRRPIRNDELIEVEVTQLPPTGVRVEHRYRFLRGSEPLAEAYSRLACVGRDGRPMRMPDNALSDAAPAPAP